MDWWMEYRIKQQEYQAQAVHQRLVQAALTAGRQQPTHADQVLAALGRRLHTWGERLEARAPQPIKQREVLA